MSLFSGSRLGPYEIQTPLGAGGMGEVYRASDTRLDRTVAVKILPQHLSSPEGCSRFDREARSISSLSHPNVRHLYDVGQQDGTHYLVIEYLDRDAG
jgi:serine/threonine protein kinase